MPDIPYSHLPRSSLYYLHSYCGSALKIQVFKNDRHSAGEEAHVKTVLFGFFGGVWVGGFFCVDIVLQLERKLGSTVPLQSFVVEEQSMHILF